MQTFGFSLGSPLRLSLPPRLNRWPCHLDRWVVADMHMPLLFVRNSNSGVCVGVGESSTTCYDMVHLSDTLLASDFINSVKVSLLCLLVSLIFLLIIFHCLNYSLIRIIVPVISFMSYYMRKL